MPLSESGVWTLTPQAERLAQIRADIDDALGYPLDYDRTVDEAITVAMAALASRVDQLCALAVSTILLGSTSPQGVAARAREAGLTPGPAVPRSVVVGITGSGRVRPTAKVYDGEGRVYSIGAAYSITSGVYSPVTLPSTGLLLDNGHALLLVADVAGAQDPESTAFSFTPSISGITALTHFDTIESGKDAESVWRLRSRVAAAEAEPGNSPTGMRSALLDIPGVSAVSIAETAGSLAVSLVYSLELADVVRIAQTIFDTKPPGALTTGSQTVTVAAPDGRDATASFTALPTQGVAIVAVLESDRSVTDEDLITSATVAIESGVAALSEGQTLLLLSLQGSLASVPGLTGLETLTIDAGTDDVTPTLSTVQLVISSLSVTVAP